MTNQPPTAAEIAEMVEPALSAAVAQWVMGWPVSPKKYFQAPAVHARPKWPDGYRLEVYGPDGNDWLATSPEGMALVLERLRELLPEHYMEMRAHPLIDNQWRVEIYLPRQHMDGYYAPTLALAVARAALGAAVEAVRRGGQA